MLKQSTDQQLDDSPLSTVLQTEMQFGHLVLHDALKHIVAKS